jgi:hypothetical protein
MKTRHWGFSIGCVVGGAGLAACGPVDPADQAQIDEQNVSSTEQQATAPDQQVLLLQQQLQRQPKAYVALGNILKKTNAVQNQITRLSK